MQATHSLLPPKHTRAYPHAHTHTVTATSHKVKSFSRVQKPSETPQIYMNLQRPASNEGKDDFLLWNVVSVSVFAYMFFTKGTCVD